MNKNIKNKLWRRFTLQIALPSIIAIVIFNILIFGILIPKMSNIIIEQKKELIKELTLTAWSELLAFYKKEQRGELSREVAQQEAINQIQNMRYGELAKDYFWISDIDHKMIMHPYRPDLIGKSLTEFKDKNNKKPFVEFADIVRAKSEGYAEYLWQWKDESLKVVPKLSFVKGFDEWGWIIGTGVYLDDIQNQIKTITHSIVVLAFVISFIIFALLLYLVRVSFTRELQRLKTEDALFRSEEKYRLLTESSTTGIILLVNDVISYANRTFFDLIDNSYTLEELRTIRLSDLLTFSSDHQNKVHHHSHQHTGHELINVIKKNGEQVLLECVSTSISLEGHHDGKILTFSRVINHNTKMNDKFGQLDRTDNTDSNNRVFKNLLNDLHGLLEYPNTTLTNLKRPIVSILFTTTIDELLKMFFKSSDLEIVLIVSADGESLGFVLRTDIVERVFKERRDLKTSVASIMSSPISSIDQHALVFEAIALMQEKSLNYLILTNEMRMPVGIVGVKDLLLFQKWPLTLLVKRIEESLSINDLKDIVEYIPHFVSVLLESGAKSVQLLKIISTINDLITKRVIDLKILELGNISTPFCFVVFGSEARCELTFVSDQDNGIVFRPNYDEVPQNGEQEYFTKLGNEICKSLEELGRIPCSGGVMASNPKWCQSLLSWQKTIVEMCKNASSNDLRELTIFSDMRVIYGDRSLVDQLKFFVQKELKNNSILFYNLVNVLLESRPPIGVFGLQFENDSSDFINLKTSIVPLVNLVKIYSLNSVVTEENTLLRLRELVDRKIISKATHDELEMSYQLIMQIRLRWQLAKMFSNKTVDNLVPFSALTQIEQVMLKKALSDIALFLGKARSDFTQK